MIIKKLMPDKLKILFVNYLVNFILLCLIFLGVQNANQKSKIYFLSTKSVDLPIGFIVGASFIIGSTIGSSTLLLTKNN